MFNEKGKFYDKIVNWVNDNEDNTFYIYPAQQSNKNFYDFCLAVLDCKKIPVLITNVGAFNRRYPFNLRNAMSLSENIRVYESAKMGLNIVLKSKAELFVKTNGGVVWTR
jgi:hypothetical protein